MLSLQFGLTLLSLLLPLVLELMTFVTLLLCFLPFAVGALDTQRGNSDAGGVLQAGFVFQFVGLLGRHGALFDFLLAGAALLDGLVDGVGGVDGGDGGEGAREDFLAAHFLVLAFFFRGGIAV